MNEQRRAGIGRTGAPIRSWKEAIGHERDQIERLFRPDRTLFSRDPTVCRRDRTGFSDDPTVCRRDRTVFMRDRTVFTGDPTIYMRDRTVFTGDPTKGRPAMAMRLPIARGEFLLEAIEVATACEQHHERLAGLPGMGNAAERIHDLVTRVRAIAAPRERKANCDAAKRARSFLKAAGAVLEVGGDVERVRRLRRDHPLRNATPTKLALAVEAYELLLRERALLEEARASVAELAMELRSTPTRAREKREARMRATKERDAVLSELREVIGVVRVIARGVFADDPQTVRKFTSASGRKRRRAQRAAHNVMVPVVVAST